MKTAILVDGSFFLKRFRALTPNHSQLTPEEIAKQFYTICLKHLNEPHRHKDKQNKQLTQRREFSLYRIFYYDSYPLDKKIHHPITNKLIDFSKTDIALFNYAFLEELKKKRKVALRMGTLNTSKEWVIRPRYTKKLLKKEIAVDDLGQDDLQLSLRQKGVDIKIGMDIASLAYKKQVDKIILVSGDSDFVPASKLARREGIDFVLDPMRNPISPDLHEHIGGLRTTIQDLNKPTYNLS